MDSERGLALVCTDRDLLLPAIEKMVQGVFRIERLSFDGFEKSPQTSGSDGPDSLILDCETGVPEMMRRMSKRFPTVPIVVWQRTNAAEASLHALELGACGVLHDSSTAQDIVSCLAAVQEGHVWVPRSVAQANLDFRRYRLSPREWEVMNLVSRGLCNKEIAYAMGITEGTTKVYLSRMFDKLEVGDRYELALLGLRHLSQSNTRMGALGAGSDVRREKEEAQPHALFVYRPPVRLTGAMERHF